jgi:hypothetical protein
MTTTSTKWAIDATHSTIEFKTKHLMITTVSGNLKSYEATIETESYNFDKKMRRTMVGGSYGTYRLGKILLLAQAKISYCFGV